MRQPLLLLSEKEIPLGGRIVEDNKYETEYPGTLFVCGVRNPLLLSFT